MAYNPRDRFWQKAKKEGLRARSAYKLEEIQKRFHVLRPGGRVLDLGAAPGGWCQIAAREVGPKGFVLGVDLEAIAPLAPPAHTWVAEAFTPELLERLRSEGKAPYDAVLSDLAPKTSGIRGADEARSLELAGRARQRRGGLAAAGGQGARTRAGGAEARRVAGGEGLHGRRLRGVPAPRARRSAR